MEFQRSHRVAEQIHHEISQLLIKGLKDPRIGFATITAVDVTPDMHLARVFFTAIGNEEARRNTEQGLKSSIPYLRRELGRRLRMRYVPDLLFQYDTSIEYGDRIESLIKEIHGRDEDHPDDSDAD